MIKKNLEETHGKLVIQNIFLHEGEIKTQEDFCPLLAREPLEIEFKNYVKNSKIFEGENADKEHVKLIVFHYVAGFRVLPHGLSDANKENNILVETIATFSACYSMTGDMSDEAISTFAKFNVGFNVWPYWREYASSTATRLGLPSFAIPLYFHPKTDC